MSDDESGANEAAPDETNDVREIPLQRVLLRELPIRGEISESDVRAKLAYGLAGIYAGTILLSFIVVWATNNPEIRQLIQDLIAAETGLFGTVLGFYFGGKANTRGS